MRNIFSPFFSLVSIWVDTNSPVMSRPFSCPVASLKAFSIAFSIKRRYLSMLSSVICLSLYSCITSLVTPLASPASFTPMYKSPPFSELRKPHTAFNMFFIWRLRFGLSVLLGSNTTEVLNSFVSSSSPYSDSSSMMDSYSSSTKRFFAMACLMASISLNGITPLSVCEASTNFWILPMSPTPGVFCSGSFCIFCSSKL